MVIIFSGLIMLILSILILNIEKIAEIILPYLSNLYNYIHDIIFDIKTKGDK